MAHYKVNIMVEAFFGNATKIYSIILTHRLFVHNDYRLINHIWVIGFAEFFTLSAFQTNKAMLGNIAPSRTVWADCTRVP